MMYIYGIDRVMLRPSILAESALDSGEKQESSGTSCVYYSIDDVGAYESARRWRFHRFSNLHRICIHQCTSCILSGSGAQGVFQGDGL